MQQQQRPGIIGRANRPHARSRRLSGETRIIRPVPIGVVRVATGAANTLVVTLDPPVDRSGIPQFLKNGTAAPTAATLASPVALTLTYPAGAEEPSTLTIPFEDPAVRNRSAGFVNAGTVTIAAAAAAEGEAAGFVGPGSDAIAA